MDYKDYSQQKQDFDKKVMQYICKRLLDPIEDTDAYKMDLVDSLGQRTKEPSADATWAFTALDNLMLRIRQMIGAKQMEELLGNYASLRYIDPLLLINRSTTMNYGEFKKYADSIITKVESRDYLPDRMYHDSNQTWVESDEELSFGDRLSKSLTILTYLLYTLRNDKEPGNVDFECNVVPSVESTFNIRAFDDFDIVESYCNDKGLCDHGKITQEGMRLLSHASGDIIDAGLTNAKRTRIEDQSYNWVKLSEI